MNPGHSDSACTVLIILGVNGLKDRGPYYPHLSETCDLSSGRTFGSRIQAAWPNTRQLAGGTRLGQLMWNARTGNAKIRLATVYLLVVNSNLPLFPLPPSTLPFQDKEAGVVPFLLGSYKKEKLI